MWEEIEQAAKRQLRDMGRERAGSREAMEGYGKRKSRQQGGNGEMWGGKELAARRQWRNEGIERAGSKEAMERCGSREREHRGEGDSREVGKEISALLKFHPHQLSYLLLQESLRMRVRGNET